MTVLIWPLVFLVAAVVSGVLGFGLAGFYPSEIWKMVFYATGTMFVASFILAVVRTTRVQGADEDEDAPKSDRGLPTDET